MGIVHGKSPGTKNWERAKTYPKLMTPITLILNKTRCIGRPDGEKKVVDGGENPPATEMRFSCDVARRIWDFWQFLPNHIVFQP